MNDNLKLLYGRGETERIVATEPVPSKENLVQVFVRGGKDDTVTATYKKYKPFIYLNENDSVIDKFYDGTEVTPLMGSNYYNTMVSHENYGFISWIRKNADDYQMPFLQSQWMIHSGETQFKGMGFDDPLRLYCDIEVVTKEGFDFPNSTRDEDKITIISMRTNRGDEWALVLNEDGYLNQQSKNIIRCKSEKILLEKWVTMVRKIDPDVITGHNFFGFDLPYIRDRAQLLSVPLQLGRDGSEITSFQTSIKFAEKSDEYENFQIYGRHITDTYFAAKSYDVVARTLDSYGLKNCVKHLGKASEDRVYIEGNEIANVWRNQHPKWTRNDLIDYAFDDVRETEVLDKEWGGASFELTKMVPLPLQDVIRYGTGNKINTIFQRHYYDYMWSYPKRDEREDYGGGYANTFSYGFFGEDSVYMDVSSLYPTLMELLKTQPPKDELQLFSTLLPLVKNFRYDIKAKAKKYEGVNESLHKKYKANDGAIKIFLNGFYGWLGWQYGEFNYYRGADEVTSWGRKVAKRMNEEAKLLGGNVLRTDTDGSLIIVPEEFRGTQESETTFIKQVEKNLNVWVNEQLSTGLDVPIGLDHDGRFKRCIIFDDKSYVLLGHDGKKKIKGNTLTGRSNEPFVIEFISSCVDHVLNEEVEKIKDEYLYWYDRIEYKMMEVDEIKKRQTLNQSLEEYNNKIAAGQNRIPQYEAAVSAEKDYIKGDVIETWVEEPEPVVKEYKTVPNKTVIPKGVSSSDQIRHVKKWNGNIYRHHYHARLEKGLKKFLVVIGLDAFEELFPDISILKPDKAKFVGVWGLDTFMEKYPDFGWREKDYNELNEDDQIKFQKYVLEGKLNEDYREYY